MTLTQQAASITITMQHSPAQQRGRNYCVEKNRDCTEAIPRSSNSSRLELMDSLKALKTWQWRMNDANNTPATTSANISSTTTAKSNDPMEEDNKMSVIMKRFGMMFNNSSLKDEVVPRSSSSENDVAVPAMMNMVIPPASQSSSAAQASNNTVPSSSPRRPKSSSSSLQRPPPRSILKSTRVYHSDEVDDAVSNATSSAHLLRLLMVSDSFSTEDRVNVGVDVNDVTNAATADVVDVRKGVGGRRTNSVVDSASKEQRGEERDGSNERLSLLAKEAATKEAVASLFSYKPQSRRSISPDSSTAEKESASPPSPESTSSPERAIKSLQALALLQEQGEKKRISNDTALTTLLCDSESQVSSSTEDELQRLEAEFIAQEKIKSLNIVNGEDLNNSDTMQLTQSTGTMKDATKRRVRRTVNGYSGGSGQNTNTNTSWGNLYNQDVKKKPRSSSNANSASSLASASDLFPSTGTFRDTNKRRVRHRVQANQDWDFAASPPFQNVDTGSSRKKNVFASPSSDEPSICLSTGTFKDARRRHVHELEHKIPPTMVQQSDNTSNNVPEVIGAEAVRPGNIFQRYMENKEKLLLQQNQQEQQCMSKRKEPKAGELLVDWGDEGSLTDSEDDDVPKEQQPNQHEPYITIVKNDSSRRVSDITTTDNFSDDDSEFDSTLDNSYSMRERIRSLSIAEENDKQAQIVDYSDVGGEIEEEDDEEEDEGPDSQEILLPLTSLQRYSSGELGKGLIRNMSMLSLVELHDEDEDVVDESDGGKEDKSPPKDE